MTDEKPAYKIAAGWLTNARVGTLDAEGRPISLLTDLPAPSSGLTYEFAVAPIQEHFWGGTSVTWEFNPRNRKEWRRWLRFFNGGRRPNRHILHAAERRQVRVARRTARGF